MEQVKDVWHLAFANLVQSRAPPNFEVQTEVRLTIEPQRADMLLIRRIGAAREDEKAQILRWLWPRLGSVSILEFKSPVNSSFRPGDLLRLVGYGVLYDTCHLGSPFGPPDLTLVLVVASMTPTLQAELERMSWTLSWIERGYGRIEGVMYTTYIVVTDDVTEAERDEYLRLFSHRKMRDPEAFLWFKQWMREKKMKEPRIEHVPGWDEIMKSFLDRLPLEERLAGIPPEHQILALSVEVLRGLPAEYIRTLPADVQEEIRRRLENAAA